MIPPAALSNIKHRCQDIDTMTEAYRWGKPLEECFDTIKKCTESIRVQVQCIELETKEVIR